MKEEIKQLHELENELHNKQKKVLKHMISKTKNKSITNFLNDLLETEYYVPMLSDIIEAIFILQIHKLCIGSKVSKDFDERFGYSCITEYDEESVYDLIFSINNDYVIENIRYEIM